MKKFELDINDTKANEPLTLAVSRSHSRPVKPIDDEFHVATRPPLLSMSMRGTFSRSSTRVIRDVEFDDSSIHASVAANTGIPADQCAEVLAAYMDQLFMCAAGSRFARVMHELLSMIPDRGHESLMKESFQVAA